VFSVIVLINIATINCAATRQAEGEFIFLLFKESLLLEA
jgi:hypothetical protein